MLYKLLGLVVWNGAKFVLRSKYGRTYAPKPLLAGAVIAVVAGVAVFAARRESS